MRKSEYVQRLEKEEKQRFEQEQKKQSLQKIYDQSGSIANVLKNYVLSEQEASMLQEIDEQAQHQKELDAAFLRGFTGGK